MTFNEAIAVVRFSQSQNWDTYIAFGCGKIQEKDKCVHFGKPKRIEKWFSSVTETNFRLLDFGWIVASVLLSAYSFQLSVCNLKLAALSQHYITKCFLWKCHFLMARLPSLFQWIAALLMKLTLCRMQAHCNESVEMNSRKFKMNVHQCYSSDIVGKAAHSVLNFNVSDCFVSDTKRFYRF